MPAESLKQWGIAPLFDPQDGGTVMEPPGNEQGFWVGGCSALYDPDRHMDNVIVTPHSAGSSDNSRVRSPLRVGQESARILTERWPMSLVNPEVRANLAMRQLGQNVYGD